MESLCWRKWFGTNFKGVFYTYTWYRQKSFTPYYVGKGTGDRAFVNDDHGVHRPTSLSLILVQVWESEEKAFEIEKCWIKLWGRKDIGTGLLRNRTDGGEGNSNFSEEVRKKIGNGMRGKKRPPRSKEWNENASRVRKGLKYTRRKPLSTRCKNGHERIPENLKKSGQCKLCRKMKNKGTPAGRKKQTHCDRGHDKLGRKRCSVCTQEKRSKGRRVLNPGILKPFCSRGHARTPDNVYDSGECKICAIEKSEIRRKLCTNQSANRAKSS